MPCPSSFGPACEQKVILGYFLMLAFEQSKGFLLELSRETSSLGEMGET